MLGRVTAFLYGVFCYVAFLASFLYADLEERIRADCDPYSENERSLNWLDRFENESIRQGKPH